MARHNVARQKRYRTRGFSIIEALLAIIVIAFAILAMGTITPYSFSQVQVNSTQVQAVAIAQQVLDAQRSWKLSGTTQPTATTVPIDQGNSFISGTQNNQSGNFNVSPDACPLTTAGTFSNQYTCSVTVTWTENNEPRSLTVQSIVTAK